MKAILIDDEPLARELVKEYLSSFPQIEVVAECNDGFEGLKAIQQFEPDLLFLDVQMPKITGFEMLELVDKKPAVIFTTAFDQYAIKAFESNAIDYLLKPFSKERFEKAVEKYLNNNSNNKITEEQISNTTQQIPNVSNRVVVKEDGKIKIIPAAEINYIEANGDNIKIVCESGSYSKNKTMTAIENSLAQEEFVRIHRSYLVNLSLITKIEAYEKDSHLAILKSGIQLPVSKSGYTKLKSILGI